MNYSETWKWWQSKRLEYNISIAIAGIVAFILYATLIWSFQSNFPEAEITFFTTIFQGIAYLVAMAFANICFFAGPILEITIKPTNRERYRAVTFNLGKYFSIILPFMVPLIIVITLIMRSHA